MGHDFNPRWMTEDLRIFHDAALKFFERECAPHAKRWDEQGVVDREVWTRAGEAGLLCASMPEEYGGAGGDFAHEAVLIDARMKAGAGHFGISLHNGIVAPYILHYGSEEQKRRWLPRLASGELVGAIAMTEPGTGSDLQGVRTSARLDGNQYVLNGSKTFITNGQTANLIIVVAKTDPAAGAKGTSLIVVETDAVDGFRRGRNLDKIGLKGQDTSELFFDDVRVPTSSLLGPQPGLGFVQLMQQLPQERLIIALEALAGIEAGIAATLDYVKQRKAFGQRIIDFQNTRFTLAQAVTEMRVARAFCDDCTERHLKGELDAATAAMAKLWLTERQCAILDDCLQLHGGYGYMNEYPIARLWADARVGKIYGGTNEIMKELIGRTL
ncbi:acyl-CoA dehydrogenase family protein [Rhodospirillum centenum]|uniref:Acyl-[acyl-carrier-protein] dehydrogenase MbtN n=1 Tax=Rhodospirillum centenum (strain ATCC 51521 / SW) TaxID=414684 RepID=B6IQT2_RHOCS|nr:acyl-CoA dehydrogenase family protein [Rhodospirillum centenum]ACI97818.1 acyl-CoA dehydrogenase [Rhodospirillum centenum SW]